MIQLTRLNHERIVVNSDLIVFVEANPDTVVTTTNGDKIRVLESPDDIVHRVVEFRQDILDRRERLQHG